MKNKLPPGIHEISREKTTVQEEFIAAEARPSRDVSEVPCPRCGKAREEWTGGGVQKGDAIFCSWECAEKNR